MRYALVLVLALVLAGCGEQPKGYEVQRFTLPESQIPVWCRGREIVTSFVLDGEVHIVMRAP